MAQNEDFPLDVKLLESVIDELPIGAILLDDEGIIQRFNRFEEQLSGRSREDTIGRSFFSDIAPCTKDIELGPKFHRGVENNDLDLSVEFSFPYPYNRVPRDVFIRARTVSDGGRHVHVVLIEDITSRRQLERNNSEIMRGLRAMLKRRGLGEAAPQLTPGFDEVRPVEREACVLWADLVGFRYAASKLEPSELFPVLDRRLREAVDVIHRRGGRVDQIQGDSLSAYFLPSDGNRERLMFDAVRAAFTIARGESTATGLELPFRVGLAHGTVLNGPIGRAEFHDRVTVGRPLIAARTMAQIGRANELIIGAEIQERLGDAVRSRPLRGPGGVSEADLGGEVFEVHGIHLPEV